jgi:hypothetical protein
MQGMVVQLGKDERTEEEAASSTFVDSSLTYFLRDL